jgi:hypothetical protein
VAATLLVNITGPDGKQYEAGTPVPAGWDAEYVKSLVRSGGAGTQKAWDEWVAAQTGEAVTAAAKAYRAKKFPETVQAALDAVRTAPPDDRPKAEARARAALVAVQGGPPSLLDAIVAKVGGEAK